MIVAKESTRFVSVTLERNDCILNGEGADEYNVLVNGKSGKLLLSHGPYYKLSSAKAQMTRVLNDLGINS